LHQFTEPGQPHPKVLKRQRTRSLGPAIIGKEERAMVRQRGREGMENMHVEAKIPLVIGVEGV
jgi:hypothetical protein